MGTHTHNHHLNHYETTLTLYTDDSGYTEAMRTCGAYGSVKYELELLLD